MQRGISGRKRSMSKYLPFKLASNFMAPRDYKINGCFHIIGGVFTTTSDKGFF